MDAILDKRNKDEGKEPEKLFEFTYNVIKLDIHPIEDGTFPVNLFDPIFTTIMFVS